MLSLERCPADDMTRAHRVCMEDWPGQGGGLEAWPTSRKPRGIADS
jgi:hypothetical protein